MADVILCNISDAHTVVEEEKNFWVQDILLALGVSEDTMASALDIDDYIYQMNEYGIEVEYKTNGEVLIYKKAMYRNAEGDEVDWLSPTKEHLVAHWKPPTYVRKVEGKDVFYEIRLNKWSSFNMRLDDE